jgi:hypothetical protein
MSLHQSRIRHAIICSSDVYAAERLLARTLISVLVRKRIYKLTNLLHDYGKAESRIDQRCLRNLQNSIV